VRQLRLRDIGGIIVIDFIDMANPKNRATVEEALKSELERDRTKTYVVEISPLGLVEMTRQNVTDGPREILTRKCTVCGGDGVVLSEASAAVDAERRLRALASSAPRTKAFKVELESKVASTLIGPGASRLMAIEEETKRRFLLVPRSDVPVDHFEELGKGTLESLVGDEAPPLAEGKQVELKLGEVGRYDVTAGIGKLDGVTVCVGNASGLVGKRAKVRIERVLNGTAYATLVGGKKAPEEPITAESAAEKPTRKPPTKKLAAGDEPEADAEVADDESEPEAEAEAVAETDEPETDEPETDEPETDEPEVAKEGQPPAGQTPKKRTRRGSRGGRGRKRKPAGAAANGGAPAETAAVNGGDAADDGPRIHLPDRSLGGDEPEPKAEAPASAEAQPEAAATSANGAEADGEAPKPKKKTRRGSRGGRRRRKPAAAQGGGSPGGSAPSE
jgi:ribonuclease G